MQFFQIYIQNSSYSLYQSQNQLITPFFDRPQSKNRLFLLKQILSISKISIFTDFFNICSTLFFIRIITETDPECKISLTLINSIYFKRLCIVLHFMESGHHIIKCPVFANISLLHSNF